MAVSTVSVTLPGGETDSVDVLRAHLRKSTNQLRIKLSRKWYDLSSELRDKLFDEAKQLYNKRYKGQLYEDWTPEFYPA